MKKQLFLKSFLVLIISLSCLTVGASESKKECLIHLVNDAPVMSFEEAAKYYTRELTISQCGGTCWFESYMSVLEQSLYKRYGNDFSVSRIEAFKSIVLSRFYTHTDGVLFQTLRKRNQRSIRNSIIDGGYEGEVSFILKRRGVVLTNKKSQTDLYRDRKIMNGIYKVSQEVTESYELELKKIFVKFREYIQKYNKEITHEFNLTKNYDKQDVDKLNHQLEVLNSTGEVDSREVFHLLESLIEGNTIQMSESKFVLAWTELLYFKKNLDDDFFQLLFDRLNLYTEWSGERKDLDKIVENKDYDLADEYKPYVKGANVWIKEALNNGYEITLGYYHIVKLFKNPHNFPGVVDLPEDHVVIPLEKRKLIPNAAGNHAIHVVARFIEAESQKEYLVLKNSHGLGAGNRGYHFMSLEYADNYALDISIFKPIH